jgi:carboxyl-terminal processing protease
MMSPWRVRGLAAVVGGFLVGAALSPALVGCVPENSSLRRMVQSVSGSGGALPANADRELTRFATVYRDVSSDPTNTRELKQFKDAFVRVRSDYLRPVNDRSLIDAAIKGVRDLEGEPRTVPPEKVVEAALDAMVASLDPHSVYLNPEQLQEFFTATEGRFGGLGIEVTSEDGYVKVVSPIEGTPAERAGLKSGDLITHLDGSPIHGISIMDAVKRMRGEPGTDIRLTIRRGGSAAFDATLTRAVITTRPIRWGIEDDVGYIRVASFDKQVEDGVREAMAGILRQVGPRLKGMVLDLRNNPGGLLDESLALVDIFLEKGRIVEVRGRDPANRQIFSAKSGDEAKGVPMVVLINGGSASASEIVASALQEDGRAIIMGTRSFGKGSVQTIMPLPIKGALKLTTALYYGPSGRTIQGLGVTPDIVITGSDVLGGQRESDLPGALTAGEQLHRVSLGNVAEANCPIPPGGKDDRQLGCAVSFLKAGSAERFLASIPAGARL